ncbi:MAG TPA: hypothetical protein VJQ86_07505, partial [Rhodanobacteraceae bacterium]|nr:hypothetical protein [Rhodanobacteraceae bacterium]
MWRYWCIAGKVPILVPVTPLTDRQRAILEFIAAAIGEGLPPTLAEIAAAFGFNQPRAAYKHLQ